MKNVAGNVVVSQCSQRASATKKYLSAKDVIFVSGEQMKATDVAQVFQDVLDAREVVATAKAAYNAALATRDAAEAKRSAADAALRPYVVQRFGPGSAEAHAFGYVPKKPADKTAVSKAKAALLGSATRDARGTMSKKEKRKIKGTLSPEVATALGALSPSASNPAVSTGTAATLHPATMPAPAPAVAPTPVVPAATNGAIVNGSAHS